MQLLKIYSFPIIATALIWLACALWVGPQALVTVIILTLLEITLSTDNAIVNSKIVATLSPFWRRMFMTIGILFAVFIVRFTVPVIIISLSAGLNFGEVVNLELHNPEKYVEYLSTAAPIIDSFGGAFLLLVALSYFVDYEKNTHWIVWLEKSLGKLGRFDNFTTFVMLIASMLLYATVGGGHGTAVLLAAICAMALHSFLNLVDTAFTTQGSRSEKIIKSGIVGLIGFLYLEILDISFSLDGVVGAFAVTRNVALIMAGLGAGAVWVRTMTTHLMRIEATKRYIYLEHGAHWAIAFLGAAMWLRLYDIHIAEWTVGFIGLALIGIAGYMSLAIAPKKRIQSR